jgi:predicted dehydrogenase/threonine dehydrogenase-like Zn-dependent dehydrogenase
MIATRLWLTCRAMKQVVLRGGQPIVADHPAPAPQPGSVLVANAASVISSGTERAAVESGGGGSLPVRAIRNPELVTAALRHMREHGVRETIDVARGTTAPDNPLGYSCAGTVLDTGGVSQFRVGQRVACAGAGRANHAEVVSVPANLVAPVPDGVPFEDAAFTTLGAIAMQGVRRTEPTLGERVVVAGLGLLGLMTVQILRASGCRVLGVEPVAGRRRLAEELGAERAVEPDDAAAAVRAWTDGIGADSVVITASTPSDAVVNSGVELLRRKGRLVPVGDVGLGLERAPLYRREADVLISTSYGPGRYDSTYEEQGIDYPIEYVRWTENRNMEAFLHLLSTGAVRVEPLAEMMLPVDRVSEAYEAIAGDSPPLAAVLTYEGAAESQREVVRGSSGTGVRPATGALTVAIVGAGGFVSNVHVPNLKAAKDVRVKTVVTRSGTTAGDVARLVGGADTATDWRIAVEDPEIDLVLIGTRHDTHAEIAAAALRAGKAVFVEKPLGLTREQIDDVWAAGRENDRLAIGFNRPFAPLARALGEQVAEIGGPLHVIYRVSSPLPHEHWLNDPVEGGGRLLGEGCHMIDFANWLCGVPALVHAAALPAPGALQTPESSTVTVQYETGSVATVHYSGVGDSSLPKERVEVLGGGRAWVLDDFSSLTAYAGGSERTTSERRADKGHAALLDTVLAAARGERPFEPGLGAAYAAQSVGLAALESLATGGGVEVRLPDASA